MTQLLLGDCVQGMRSMDAATVDLVVADPPYNIGFDYGGEYDDSLSASEYSRWSRDWIEQVARVLKPDGSFWLIIGDEWAADLVCTTRSLGLHMRSWIIWYYTFGVNCEAKFTRSHAHVLYFTKHRKRFKFYPEQIRVPSARELVYHDKRASPAGRLPDDTWILRPQELDAQAFPEFGDTWHIPRIAGTFKQRVPGIPNQIPEQLIGRIIRACTQEGDLVLDPFLGSGTTAVVAKKLRRRYGGYEQSQTFLDGALRRLAQCLPGDPLDGPITQGSST